MRRLRRAELSAKSEELGVGAARAFTWPGIFEAQRRYFSSAGQLNSNVDISRIRVDLPVQSVGAQRPRDFVSSPPDLSPLSVIFLHKLPTEQL